MKPTKNEFNALLRSDLTSFIQKCFHTINPGTLYLHNWHIEVIAWHLQQCHEGRIKRLIITLPPRSLKSIITSVALPAWLLGLDPTQEIIVASYAQNLTDKHALDCRAIMESTWYQDCFPHTRIHRDKNAVTEFMTTQRGGRMATSVGGTPTGRGGNWIIIDDPLKADEGAVSETSRSRVIEWFRNTLLSRLNNQQDDVIILIQQRLHENDLAGYLLETGEWTHLNIPAIAEEAYIFPIGDERFYARNAGDILHPQREPKSVLDGLKEQLGSYNFAAQYQQRPAPMGGGIIQWEWFQIYEVQPSKEYGEYITQSWDTACKADAIHDYSVCTTWLHRGNDYYLLHVTREHLEFTQLKQRIIDHAKLWDADYVLIEDKAAGTSLIQDLRSSASLNIVAIVPENDKATRMMAASPVIEGGRVYLPVEAPWLADFQREIVNFPRGKYDDQVDSMSQFLNWSKTHSSHNCCATLVPSRVISWEEYERHLEQTYGLPGTLY